MKEIPNTPWYLGKQVFSRDGLALDGELTTIKMSGPSEVVVVSLGASKEECDDIANAIVKVPNLMAFAEKVARLNRDAGEIGPGMLASLVDEARRLIGGSMENKKSEMIAKSVADAKRALTVAKKEKGDALREVELKFEAEMYPHNMWLTSLRNNYKDLALEIANLEAPVSRNRHILLPDDIDVTEAGIELRWDADHSNDIVDVTVTWEQLLEGEN